jgi:hypothetical protein
VVGSPQKLNLTRNIRVTCKVICQLANLHKIYSTLVKENYQLIHPVILIKPQNTHSQIVKHTEKLKTAFSGTYVTIPWTTTSFMGKTNHSCNHRFVKSRGTGSSRSDTSLVHWLQSYLPQLTVTLLGTNLFNSFLYAYVFIL